MIFFASAEAEKTRTTVCALRLMFLSDSLRWKPEIRIVRNLKPAAGTRRSSMPPLLPTYRMCASGSFSRR